MISIIFVALVSPGFGDVHNLPEKSPRTLSTLVDSSESIVLARFSEVVTTRETLNLILEPIEAVKGQIPEGVENLLVPIGTRPPLGGHGTGRVGWTVLVFLARDKLGNGIIVPPIGHRPISPLDLVLPVVVGREHVVSQGWCDSSFYRRVVCLGSTPLLSEETSGLGAAFLSITWGDRDSEDLRTLWRLLRERGDAGAGYALAQELWYSDEDAPCLVPKIFAESNQYEQNAIRLAVDSGPGPLRRKSLRCLGDLAMDEKASRGLRVAAAMAIQRMHVPAAAGQLVRLVQSNDAQLSEIATYGLTLMATGKPPVGRDVRDLPTRVWKLELPGKLTETEQAMRRDTPELRVNGPTRGLFWVDWFYRHKDQIEAQVNETEAAP